MSGRPDEPRRPSRLGRGLLALLRAGLPRDWADDIARDVEEAHRERHARRGGMADLWLAAEVAGFLLRFLPEHLRDTYRGLERREGTATLARDLQQALRSIRRAPLSSAAVVLILAVGIGANSTIFSVVRTVVLDPVPYPHGDRLLVMANGWTPAPIVSDVARSTGDIEALEAFYPRHFTVTGGEEPAEIEGAVVTPGFLTLLGAEIALGRGFMEADALAGAAPAVLLSQAAWRRLLAAAPDAVGRTLRINDMPHEIVGILTDDFAQLTPRTGDPELWLPGPMDRLGEGALPEGAMQWAIPVARLRPGGSLPRAQMELESAVTRHRAGVGADGEGGPERPRWTPLTSYLAEGARPGLLLLQGAVGLVLLLACVNVANLLLVRFGSRSQEVAVRTALGASSGRLLRHLVTESIVLSSLGGIVGLGVAFAGVDLVRWAAPVGVPRIDDIAVDAQVLLTTLGIGLFTGLLFGIVPAVLAIRRAQRGALRGGGRGATASRAAHQLSRGLVVAEVTLTVVLVASAGLLARSFATLTAQPPGFRVQDVLAVPIRVPENRFTSVAELEDFHARIAEGLEHVPGVASVGLANNLPIRRGGSTRSYAIEGETELRVAEYAVVSPGYFEALDIPVVRGRSIEERDRRDGPAVAVVDEVMARQVWPDGDAVGRRFRLDGGDRWMTVVGVSAPVRGSGLGSDPQPGFHIPHRQRPETEVELAVGRNAVFVIHARAGAGDLGGAIRGAVHEVEPGQPVPEVRSLAAVLADGVGPERFRTLLLGAFAAIALVLVVAGIYGVVGQILADRVREMGIRRAVGATGGDVVREVLGWGMRLAGAGIVLGLVGVLLLSRYLDSLLFGVGVLDPVTLAGAVAVVILTTLVACLVPAGRAARVSALVALRPSAQ